MIVCKSHRYSLAPAPATIDNSNSTESNILRIIICCRLCDRLPRRILVDLPDLNTRKEILQVTLQGNRVADDVDLTVLAER